MKTKLICLIMNVRGIVDYNKCKCNRKANIKSAYGEWYCWTCFCHLEEEQSVREQTQPTQED